MDIEKKNLVTQEGNETEGKSSDIETGVNLFKCSVGIGVLSLPYFFNEAGFLLSMFIMIILASMTFYSTILIIRLADLRALRHTDYKELYCDLVGENAFIFFQLNMALNYYGVVVSYVIFFIEFFSNLFGTSGILYNLAYAGASLFVIMPLSLIRNYHFFVKYSVLANILMIFVLTSVIVYGIANADSNNLDNLANFEEITGILGAFLFAFEYPGQVIPIRNSTKNRDNYSRIFLSVNMIVLVVYVTFAVICCLGFSTGLLTQDILSGFSSINQCSLIITAFYAVALVLSYPIQLGPMVEVIEMVAPINNFLKKNETNKLFFNSVRIISSIFVFVCALFINNFGDFVSLVGNLSGITIQFVYPLLAYNIYMGNKLNFWTKWIHYLIICVSIVGTVCASYSSIVTLINDYA